MKKALALGLGIASLVGLEATSFAANDYGAKGPEATTTTNLPTSTGATGGKVIVPNGAGPYPILVASHGFSASADNQVGWAQHFASWGFAVAVPSFPSPLMPDADKNSTIIKDLVTYMATSLGAKVDAKKVGVEGHSAGGLATTLAIAKAQPQAVVLFDPVDRGGVGKTAYAAGCAPTLALFADGSSCNVTGEWEGFRDQTPSELVAMHVVASTHCDGENADRGIACATFCGGGADKTRQAVYARYATAFFRARLSGDAEAEKLFDKTALAADTAIANPLVKAATCTPVGPSSDAGVDSGSKPSSSSSSSGATSSGGASSSSSGAGASSSGDPAGASGGDSSSGCACNASRTDRAGAFAVLAGAVALAAATRRRRDR
ncbi:MAG: hypothetical protein JNL38_19290 [Myxococcales bacterium]|nr:hypothetical protein [Myxococcales bacterium]